MATITCQPQAQSPQASTSNLRRATASFSHHSPPRTQQQGFAPSAVRLTSESRSYSYAGTATNYTPSSMYPRHYNQTSGATAGPSTITSTTPSCHTTTTTTTIRPTNTLQSTSDTITSNPVDNDLDERPRKRARSEPPVPEMGSGPTGDQPMLNVATPITSNPTDNTSSMQGCSTSRWVSDQAAAASSNGGRSNLESGSCPTVPEEFEESQESQSHNQIRYVSPAPTEIDDPDPEYVESQLQTLGVKIRDFCYEPTPSGQRQIPELFDQYEAMAEFEFRLSQEPRTYPISGKTLRRLLNIGWIDMDEVHARCEEMDLEELRKVDSRPAWPFTLKFSKSENEKRPDQAQRTHLFESRRYAFGRMDRLRRTAEYIAMKREMDRQEAQEAMEKIRRLNAEASQEEVLSEPSLSQPMKQFPAPLSSYDPELYPEAAGVIESQQLSQGRPIPPRVDTPPLEEPKAVDNRPNALKRGLKRTLSRTQTFTQL